MKYVPDAQQMKTADQYTISNLNIPSLVLMERAANACVEVMKVKKLDLSNVCVVCGSGNNGGDGFAIARILASKGIDVTTVMAGNKDRCTTETLYQINLLSETGAKISDTFVPAEYSVIVDALFGVGLSRNIEGNYKELIQKINHSAGVKVAVDIPSGICADNGNVLGIAVKADYTITFQMEKVGLLLYPGKNYAGEVHVRDIGISEKYFENDENVSIVYDESDYKKLLPVRQDDSHKGTYGKLLIIAGSKGMSGAAYLNAMSAYFCGAGLVQIYTTEDNRIILQQLVPEAIIKTYDKYDEKTLLELIAWSDAICIGSGIGISKDSLNILKTVIRESEVPCVIDADGLNLLADHMWYMSKKKHNHYILTPHMKEMSRLTGLSVDTIKRNRIEITKEFTDKYGMTCILKDSRTIIKSNHKRTVLNLSGNSAMAKAGSGDVLAGIIAGFLVQTKSCYESAVLGTYIHGKCGDIMRKEKGSYSVLARDLIFAISDILKREEGI